MNLSGRQVEFRSTKGRDDPYRIMVLVILVLFGFVVLKSLQRGSIKSPFLPTAVPTRTTNSYQLEGETHFKAGNLASAIAAYQNAIAMDVNAIGLYSELARIQTYSSTLLTTDAEKKVRLHAALEVVNKGVELAPEDATIWAVKSFVENWLANPSLSGDETVKFATQSEQSAVRALQLDSKNTLALVFYAELLIDQQKWQQAEQYIKQARAQAPDVMDAHRVYGFLMETYRNYGEAINAYKRAVEINPNFTYLYMQIGLNYRVLENYEDALVYFEKAARINEQQGIKDPLPYLAIGKTYTRQGEFYIASRNMKRALQYNPYSPDIYGQLGIVYYKARNYEGALEALECATYGCDEKKSCMIREDCDSPNAPSIKIGESPVTPSTVVYYYTYGSALAGLHRPSNNYCLKAKEIFKVVHEKFGGDAEIMAIIEPSENICASATYH